MSPLIMRQVAHVSVAFGVGTHMHILMKERMNAMIKFASLRYVVLLGSPASQTR